MENNIVRAPWWLKISAKLIMSRIPVRYGFWQRVGLFRHGKMDSSDYALEVFRKHAENAFPIDQLENKIVLELGPGDSIATALIARAYNATAILVDAGRYANTSLEPYRRLARRLQERNLVVPDISACRNIDDIIRQCGGQYLTEGLESLKRIEAGKVDLIFSQAVLEHVRRGDFLATMKECRRITKTDGVGSHRIDLKDHLGGGLNNLRFNDKLWESRFFTRSGFYTNRIQYSQLLRLFEEAGFMVEVNEVRRWDALPTPKRSFAKVFRGLPDEELLVSGFSVVLR